MPIEFRCTQCQRLLRTQDDAAGKQAKCPECGTILAVPTPEVGAAAPPLPPPPAAPGNPFGAPQGTVSPFASSQPLPGGTTQNPYQSPGDYMQGPIQAGPVGTITHTYIDLSDGLNRTWPIFTNQYWLALGVFFAVWLLNVAVNIGGTIANGMAQAAQIDPGVVVLVYILVTAGSWLFSTWLGIGAALCYLKIARGQPTSVGEVFSGGPYLLRVLAATVLFVLILTVILLIGIVPAMGVAWAVAANADGPVLMLGLFLGAALAFIPSVIVSLGLSQYYYLILDQHVGVLDSLSISWRITRGNRLTLFAIWTITSLLGLLVTLFTCGLGAIFLVFPFLGLMMPVIYLAMTGQPTADQLYRPR